MTSVLALSSHHFIIIEGEIDIDALVEHHALSPLDIFRYAEDIVTIDVVRDMYTFFTTRSLGTQKKAYIQARSLTHEAQNALLKLTEELQEGNQIIMGVSSHHTLIPTVRSRAEVVRIHSKHVLAAKERDAIEAFLKKSIPARIKSIESIVKKKDMAAASRFIEQLIVFMRSEPTYRKRLSTQHLLALHSARRDVDVQGMSLKLLMEYISLILPKYV